MLKNDPLHLSLRLLHEKREEVKEAEIKLHKLQEEEEALSLLVDMLKHIEKERKKHGTSRMP